MTLQPDSYSWQDFIVSLTFVNRPFNLRIHDITLLYGGNDNMFQNTSFVSIYIIIVWGEQFSLSQVETFRHYCIWIFYSFLGYTLWTILCSLWCEHWLFHLQGTREMWIWTKKNFYKYKCWCSSISIGYFFRHVLSFRVFKCYYIRFTHYGYQSLHYRCIWKKLLCSRILVTSRPSFILCPY